MRCMSSCGQRHVHTYALALVWIQIQQWEHAVDMDTCQIRSEYDRWITEDRDNNHNNRNCYYYS